MRSSSVSRRSHSTSVVAALLHLPRRTTLELFVQGIIPAHRAPFHWQIERSLLEQSIATICAEHGIVAHPLSIDALLDVKQVAHVLQCGERAVRLAAERRLLPAFKLGRAWRFWAADIEALKTKNRAAWPGNEELMKN